MPTADAAQRHDRRHLTAVRDIATAVGSRLDFPSVLAAIIERVCALLDCERASLFVIDEDGGIASLVMVGDSPPIRVPPREGIAGAVVADRRSLRIDDAWQDPRFHRANDERTGFRTTSLLAVPLIEGGVVKGVVEALNKSGGAAFDDDDEACWRPSATRSRSRLSGLGPLKSSSVNRPSSIGACRNSTCWSSSIGPWWPLTGSGRCCGSLPGVCRNSSAATAHPSPSSTTAPRP
jgi:hypothetical protein